MKVFMVVRWPVGGIRTFIKYVYSSWLNPALEIHFLTPNVAEVNTLKSELAHLNCHWYMTESESPGFKEFAVKANQIIGASKFDLIHAHGFTSALSVAWKLPFLKCESIFTSHDVLNAGQFQGVKGSFKKIAIALLLNRFSVIHSVSHDAEKNLQHHLPLIDQSKCKVILNGVDTERFFNAEPANIKQQLGIPESIKLIGFFGRFMSQKGFKYLVDAMEILERNHPGQFRVVCFGSGGFIREEKSALQKRGLSELFYFHDHVSDTSPYVKACDLVAMPSLWEACGLVAMEVLVGGIPIVASSCVGLREVCEGSPAIMVEPANSEILAHAIFECSQLPLIEFKDYAISAKSRFTISATREHLQKLYSELVSL
jgi:glycosyltransferase involved in cell wall biosynthesis